MPQSTFPRPSIQTLVAILVVSPILIVSTVLAGLSWVASARISENLGEEVMAAAARSAAIEVHDYLSGAVDVSDRYVRRIEAGVLPDPPLPTWERMMLDDLTTSPSVASICYGTAAGNATWLLRGPGRLELGRAIEGKLNGTAEFEIDAATGKTVGEPFRVYTYDPRTRPWWDVAQKSDKPMWTPVYVWYAGKNTESMIGTGYTRSIHGADGQLRGVLVVDVALGGLNEFLGRLDIADKGDVFIIDSQNRLVAASRGPVTDEQGECLAMSASPQPAAQAVGTILANGHRSRSDLQNLNLSIKGHPSRARITEMRPFAGIDWRVVAILPESEFLGQAQSVRRRAVVASSAATLVSLIIGVFLARHLSQPIVRMTQHVKKVGSGDFETRLDLHGAKELVILSEEINRMASGLKERMALEQSLAVAMEVQKSLLPAGDPVSPLLDIAGRSKYCDQTGGDYYDFIDVAAISASSMLIAVGDVTGHGIPAALVMATARAALRTSVQREHKLADLMTRTNQVLSADNRHNLFMTLSLLLIDAASRRVRWASAGHDPAIVYDPLTNSSHELDGGDIPLGLVEGTEYEEFGGDPLPVNSVIIIGTDGVWEMFNEREEQYGKERMERVVRENHSRPAAEIAAALDADLASFRGNQNPVDDVTFVIIKLLPS